MVLQHRQCLLDLNHKSVVCSQFLYERLIWLLHHEHMREQVPVKLKSGGFRSVEGNAEKPLCCRLQITSIWREGHWRAEAAPCEEPTGNMLPATWQWHLDILFFASLRGEKKLDLFGDHRGFDACCVIRRCSALPLLSPCAYYRFH